MLSGLQSICMAMIIKIIRSKRVIFLTCKKTINENNFGTLLQSLEQFFSFSGWCLRSSMAEVDWKTILTWVGQSSYKIMYIYIGIADDYSDGEMSKMFEIMKLSTEEKKKQQVSGIL